MSRMPFLVVFAVLLASGCQRQDAIETYRVSKESSADVPSPSPSASNSKKLTWQTPKGWIEQAPSAMRLGSFLIHGANGQTADVSIIPLSGPAGGSLANINRWRGQINLPAITSEQLAANSETLDINGRKMLLVDFSSQNLLVDNRFKKRVAAAIYGQGETTWFFKMMGEDSAVEQAKPDFIHFLKTLRFHGHS